MKLKIKVRPEDFIVEEVAEFVFKNKADFALYLLTKKGWNTTDLLFELSRKLKVPPGDFAYGGRKDKYGLTSQYITIRNPKHFALGEKTYSLKFVGLIGRPMGPDLIRANKFELVIRKLGDKETKNALGEIGKVKKTGYPNYFDDQRFGSLDLCQGFLAEKILKQHFNGALKIYLTGIHPEDKKTEKERKCFFYEKWGDWKSCLGKTKTKYEKLFFGRLIENPKDFLYLLRRIPKEVMSSFFSSYQSFLWNEALRRTIALKAAGMTGIYKGLAGDYIFYSGLKEGGFLYLNELYLPTPASGVKMPDSLTGEIYEGILKENGLKSGMFNNLKTRQAYFKSIMRKAIVIPRDLFFDYSRDEIYKGKEKLCLRFTLPRGSFGTMLVKRLFCSSAVKGN